MEKNNLGFPTCFFGQNKLHLSDILYGILLKCTYIHGTGQICGLKEPKKTDAKYIGLRNIVGLYSMRQIIATISQIKQRKTCRKFFIQYIKQIMFCAAFFAN